MTKLDLNELAQRIHEQNKEIGWWDEPRELGTLLMLVVSEIAEAMEGERKNLMDEHLLHRKMAEVELADVVIRLLDIAENQNIKTLFVYDIKNQSILVELNRYGEEKGSRLLSINQNVLNLYYTVYSQTPLNLKGEVFSSVITLIYKYASLYGYDIDGAMLEKIEYNRTRADHQRENRAKANGKKF